MAPVGIAIAPAPVMARIVGRSVPARIVGIAVMTRVVGVTVTGRVVVIIVIGISTMTVRVVLPQVDVLCPENRVEIIDLAELPDLFPYDLTGHGNPPPRTVDFRVE
jgi:hypothetical protein